MKVGWEGALAELGGNASCKSWVGRYSGSVGWETAELGGSSQPGQREFSFDTCINPSVHHSLSAGTVAGLAVRQLDNEHDL